MSIVLDGTTGITTPGLTNTGSETVVNLTTTGNTILGDASTDTLNVGNGGLIKDASGNLGLGVTPSAWGSYSGAMDFKGGGALGAFNSSTALFCNSYYNGTNYIYKASTSAGFYQIAGNQHQWYTAASGTAGNAITFTQAMTLDANGNLLVGTTSGGGAAGPRLYVVNGNNTNGDAGAYVQLGGNCNNTTSYAISTLITGVGNKFYVYGNGNVVNSNNSYGAISDIKFKENVVDATPKLDDVMRLKVRNFNLKTEPDNKQIGFIAQEFEEVFPSMIDVSPDTDVDGQTLETTHKSIKLSVLVPILVKAIQEQQTLIQTLTARITALEAT